MTEIGTSGFVAVTGRRNVGKSSLVNKIAGETVSITTEKPGTTRHTIRAIYEASRTQIVFTDTPGFTEAHQQLGNYLTDQVKESWDDSDLLLFVVDSTEGWKQDDKSVADQLATKDKPLILVPNKIDISDKEPKEIRSTYEDKTSADEIIPVSSKTGFNTDKLIESIVGSLPEGPRFFPEGKTTDRSLSFRISEIIRKQAIKSTTQEVPYSIAVVVDSIEPGESDDTTVIEATLFVERESQKGILIGEGGNKIRSIGQTTREEIKPYFDKNIYLDLTVKLEEEWTQQTDAIERIKRKKNRRNI